MSKPSVKFAAARPSARIKPNTSANSGMGNL